jgi:hypothetical protein
MSLLLIIIAVLLFVVAIFGVLFFKNRGERRLKIIEITEGPDLLAHWTYSPSEWETVAEEFPWAKTKGAGGDVYITPTAIYIKSGSKDRLIDLVNDGKVVTHASHRGTEGSPLKIRVRWKIIKRYDDRPDEIKYYKEDYRIPVPPKNVEEAQRVAQFFTERLEANLDAYTAVVPDDEPISLFGKDPF